METSRDRLRHIYSPNEFGDRASWVARALTEHLENAQNRPSAYSQAVDMTAFIDVARQATNHGARSFFEAAQTFLDRTAYLHSPRCIGHQVAPPIPVAGLFGAMAAVTNQGNAIHELSPFATAAERVVVRKLCEKIGWNEQSDGVLTNGGSIANLTAILTARNHVWKNSWKDGVPQNGVIFCGEGAHYSVARAAGVIGMGTAAVIKIPADKNGKMDPERLGIAIRKAKAGGKVPVCIVASACATSLGLFDDLTAIGKIAREEGIWFHVDGAHGASALFSAKYRHLVKGIEQADSVIWDAHKMMHMPALCAAVLFKNGQHGFETFQQDAPYLFRKEEGGDAYLATGLRTLECTKQSLSLPLWGALAVHGEQVFEDLVDVTFDLAREFHSLLTAQPDFVPLHAPESNILCFRYLPASLKHAPEDEISRFQAEIRARTLMRGNFYITFTIVDNVGALRVTLMNPLTEPTHLMGLLDEIRRVGT